MRALAVYLLSIMLVWSTQARSMPVPSLPGTQSSEAFEMMRELLMRDKDTALTVLHRDTYIEAPAGISCPPLSPPRDGIVCVSPGRAMYICNAGHDLVGEIFRLCDQLGRWEGIAPQCVPSEVTGKSSCPPLAAPEGGAVQVVGHTAYFRCEQGLELHGPSSITCLTLETGVSVWLGIRPRCRNSGESRCPRPIPPMHGSVKIFNNTAVFSCNRGYQVEDNSHMKCVATFFSAFWWGKKPNCIPEDKSASRNGSTIIPTPQESSEIKIENLSRTTMMNAHPIDINSSSSRHHSTNTSPIPEGIETAETTQGTGGLSTKTIGSHLISKESKPQTTEMHSSTAIIIIDEESILEESERETTRIASSTQGFDVKTTSEGKKAQTSTNIPSGVKSTEEPIIIIESSETTDVEESSRTPEHISKPVSNKASPESTDINIVTSTMVQSAFTPESAVETKITEQNGEEIIYPAYVSTEIEGSALDIVERLNKIIENGEEGLETMKELLDIDVESTTPPDTMRQSSEPQSHHDIAVNTKGECEPEEVKEGDCFILSCSDHGHWQRALFTPSPDCCSVFDYLPDICQPFKMMLTTERPSESTSHCETGDTAQVDCFNYLCMFGRWEKMDFTGGDTCCEQARNKPRVCRDPEAIRRAELSLKLCTGEMDTQTQHEGCCQERCVSGVWRMESFSATPACCSAFGHLPLSCSGRMCDSGDSAVLGCHLYVCVAGHWQADRLVPSPQCCEGSEPPNHACLEPPLPGHESEFQGILDEADECDSNGEEREFGCFRQICTGNVWVYRTFIPSSECCADIGNSPRFCNFPEEI